MNRGNKQSLKRKQMNNLKEHEETTLIREEEDGVSTEKLELNNSILSFILFITKRVDERLKMETCERLDGNTTVKYNRVQQRKLEYCRVL